MTRFSQKKALVAVDLGAQSCRVSLLRFHPDGPQMEIVHRFRNAPLVTSTGVRWDIESILEGILAGLRLCSGMATEGIAAVGVDGWAVDYVWLDENGGAVANPFCYRDERTVPAEQQVHQRISPATLYSLTGIQLLRINTLYQLYADQPCARQQVEAGQISNRAPGRAGVERHKKWLNLPEFVTYRLGGLPVAEYTNATHTQLVDFSSKQWCEEIFKSTGLDRQAAPEIVPTGTFVGSVRGDLGELSAFRQTKLIVPACHDTASAIAAIPATGDDWGFISSGTWSLVGTVLKTPCVNEEARRMNFTNLGGVGGTFCFLKNVNGMWLLQQCLDEWDKEGSAWTMRDLLQECESLPAPPALIDVDAPELLAPGNVLDKIRAQLRGAEAGAGYSGNLDPRIVTNLILHSLAARYAEVLDAVARITGKRLRRLFIVGGGSQNLRLNRLTAQRTGLKVIAGPAESTTIGNFAIQMAALAGARDECGGVAASAVAKWAESISMGSLAYGASLQS